LGKKKFENLIYDAKLAARAISGRKIFLPENISPKLAVVNLTEKCNSRCITCTCWKNIEEDGISTQRAKELLLELKELNVDMLRFSGGEPLIRKDFFEILGSVEKNSFKRIVLLTNGLLLDKYRDEINNSDITNITVSIDGTEENNDRIRGIKGYYSKALKGLEGINKQIKIVSTLSNSLKGDIEELLDICEKNNYDFDVNILDSNPYFFSDPEVKQAIKDLLPKEDQIKQIFGLLKKRGSLYNSTIENNILSYSKHAKFLFKHRMLGYFAVYISSNGEVRTGCYSFEPVGNINRSSLKEMLDSKEYKKLAHNMFDYKCPGCTCGFGVSAMYSNPLSNLSYISKRLKPCKRK